MTRDQFLCEMTGKCWHNIQTSCLGDICLKCKKETFGFAVLVNPNYSTSPADILALQQFVMEQKWWSSFKYNMEDAHARLLIRSDKPTEIDFIKWLFSDPDRFAELVAEYRGWKD